ncbi:hypothetical protein Bbelb_291560 [Branchiostoma belcheri]|nr:hypothetical protein Bbelb_291560 [Branchiostoma belcheri]
MDTYAGLLSGSDCPIDSSDKRKLFNHILRRLETTAVAFMFSQALVVCTVTGQQETMQLLVLCVTALLFGTVTAAPGQQHQSFLDLLKKDAKELAELVDYQENSLKNEAENGENLAGVEQPGEVAETKRQSQPGRLVNHRMCAGGKNNYDYWSPKWLCRECSTRRELPEDYAPGEWVERTCEGHTCLDGYGQCEEQVSTIKIMRNVGTYAQQNWREYTYVIPSGCKCTIKPATECGKAHNDTSTHLFHSVLPRDIHSIALFRGPSTAVEEARVTSYPSFSVFFLVRIYRSRSFVDAAVVVGGLLYLDLDPSQCHSGSGAEA